MRDSKDIARRSRLRGYPGRDTFRRHYFAVGLASVVLALGTWLGLDAWIGARQYLPRPVSANHALFGSRCETCHDPFREVADTACIECHALRVHSTIETGTPSCARCHTEHRGTEAFLPVSTASCIECHRDLTTRGGEPDVERHIAAFRDHPEFRPLRDGARDQARLRFNHRAHLSSTEIPEDERPMQCEKCHRTAADGRWMEPIRFESHCGRCHTQMVDGPSGTIEVPHEEPAVIREELRRSLLDSASTIGTTISAELRRQLEKVAAPEPEMLFPSMLPGRVARQGFDAERLSVALLEGELYAAFVESGPDEAEASPYDRNKRCFLCHFPEDDTSGGPRIAPTRIRERWLEGSEFSHRRHVLMPCESCHRGVRESTGTADVNLPGRDSCLSCHVDGQAESAGTDCTSCHLYHDTSKLSATDRIQRPADTCTDEGECPDGRRRLQRPTPVPARTWWAQWTGAASPTPEGEASSGR